ncbi:uncharacterized protein BJ212DRAFT_1298648 [Suillus subaureus]|uniref:Uncharacterized protein n=1 Tax=Suillus subaureus TaxID=48587 RepID=A0A9P7JEZ5_9AGAM|nr:uncharacterized protein BJ212DRAFT_1298648 [Suillus subaureus]KAG1818567.1 hypothetical protein BJ212DRAFT_1298648 [Suillus subaureus]
MAEVAASTCLELYEINYLLSSPLHVALGTQQLAIISEIVQAPSNGSTITILLLTSMPLPKEYQVVCKGHLQTVSKTRYYCLKAQDSDANMWTPELQALLVSQAQANAPIASSSASGEHTREHTCSDQSSDVDMGVGKNATEDKVYNDGDIHYANDLPDPSVCGEGHSPPPLDHPVHGVSHSPPLPDPPVCDKGHSPPPPDSPAGDKDQHTIQDVNLDDIQCLASVGGYKDILQTISFI